ncbi:hypothetical protein HanRHA438_Chr12g0532921 [Helianthus annuus]|nr:hypothetical protein HanRHA438_Chr12g0532921 [Helianthus annuus]
MNIAGELNWPIQILRPVINVIIPVRRRRIQIKIVKKPILIPILALPYGFISQIRIRTAISPQPARNHFPIRKPGPLTRRLTTTTTTLCYKTVADVSGTRWSVVVLTSQNTAKNSKKNKKNVKGIPSGLYRTRFRNM